MSTKQELAEEATIGKLRQLATDNDVDLSGLTKKQEIADAIASSRKVSKSDLEDALSDEPEVNADQVKSPDADASDAVSPTGTANVAGVGQNQLDLAPPMKEEQGTAVPTPNLRQPVIDEALPTNSASADGLDPMLTDPETAARERVEGRTSDAANRSADARVGDVPPDLGADEKPSDGGEERYPFPPQGDVDVATVDPGNGKGEYLAPLEVEDWVVLGEHELVPDRLVGRRAIVTDAPRYLIPKDKEDEIWIQVQTRDEVNAKLTIPLSAVKEVQKGGLAVTHRG